MYYLLTMVTIENKKICIIYTGGTIGMIRTANGFAPANGVLRKELSEIRDLSSPGMPAWDLVEFDPLLDSSNIAYEQWNQIANTIAASYERYDGFVVLHGTDTMAYSASALSFMLEGLDKPVVFTGSQIPLCELRSDGKDNLITSLMIAAGGMVHEVCLYFSGALLRGNRSTKISADGLIAFDSPNYPKLAKAGIDIEYHTDRLLQSGADSLKVSQMKKARLGVLKVFPGIQFGLFEPVVSNGLDGLILEAFGTGNIPGGDDSLAAMISEASENGTIVVVLTQCPQGTVRLGEYEAGAALVKAGAVSGGNMTTEAAVTKLNYLLSLGLSRDEVRALMEQPLRGELGQIR